MTLKPEDRTMGTAQSPHDFPTDPARQPPALGGRMRVGDDGLVTIPEDIREECGIERGDHGRVRRVESTDGGDRLVFDPETSSQGQLSKVQRDGRFIIPKDKREPLDIGVGVTVHVQCMGGPEVVVWPL